MVARTIDLEKKAAQAIKNYLTMRPASLYEQVLLNRGNERISERRVRKLVVRGLQKAVTPCAIRSRRIRHSKA